MPGTEDEVKVMAVKLEKMADGSKSADGALEILDALSEVPMTLDILTSTKIGKIINDFRKKISDEKAAKKAKNLIKEWKRLMDGGSSKPAERKDNNITRNDSTASNLSQKSRDSSDSQKPDKKRESSSTPMTSTSNGFPPRHLINDEVRSKAATMIVNALKHGEMPDGTQDPEDLAVKIEDALFTTHRGTGDKYKSALRSRVFNLRDKKNQALRENILTGAVKPQRFVVMTSEEMASDEIRQIREKFNKESILEHQMSVQQGTPSDMFKCGKCGKKNCTYSQLQTRSSDEPMTTFVFCLECGNRWKFC